MSTRNRPFQSRQSLWRTARALALLLVFALVWPEGVVHARRRSRIRRDRVRTEAPPIRVPAAAPASPPATTPVRAALPALPPHEIARRARLAVAAEIQAAVGSTEPMVLDRARFLGAVTRVGSPLPVSLDGHIVKYLLPAICRTGPANSEQVCGLLQVRAATGEILSWPAWKASSSPASFCSEADLRSALSTQTARMPEPPVTEREYRPILVEGDPAKLPGATLIKGWNDLPPKHQDPLLARVRELNASERLVRQLRYDAASPPPLASIAVAAASCADWWRARLGLAHGRYNGLLTGLAQYGVNPRELHSQYVSRSFPMLSPYALRDPVTSESIPQQLEGFCKILTAPVTGTYLEPLETQPGETTYVVADGAYGMDGKYLKVLSRDDPDEPTDAEAAARVDRALKSHGILLGRVHSTTLRRRPYSLHGIAVVGRAELNGQPAVLFREIYGDRGIDFPLDGTGAPMMKAIELRHVRSLYAFPHPLRMRLTQHHLPGHYELECTTSAGNRIDLDALDVRLGGALSVGVSLGGRTPEGLAVTRKDTGLYRIAVPRGALEDSEIRLAVAADLEYFRDENGRSCTESYLLSESEEVK